MYRIVTSVMVVAANHAGPGRPDPGGAGRAGPMSSNASSGFGGVSGRPG